MEVNGLDYLESLRHIVNEISFGNDAGDGDGSTSDNDDTTGDQNFMDDGGDEDTSSDTADDSSSDDDGDQNFMDDDDITGDDSGSDGESSDDSSDGDDGGDQDFMDDDDSSGEEEGSDDSGDDTSSDGGDENFMDDGGDDSGSDGESSDDSSEEGSDNSSEEEEGSDEGQQEEYDINKIEEELFSSLTPEQIAIKNHELKNQFIELYSIIGSTLVRINDISKTNENINVLKFITEKLLELREMIDFNITTAYQTRTYIENNIIYQQCIATLNAIGDIIDNIPKLNDIKVSDEEETESQGEPVEKDKESFDSLDVSDSSMSDYQEESTEYNSLF